MIRSALCQSGLHLLVSAITLVIPAAGTVDAQEPEASDDGQQTQSAENSVSNSAKPKGSTPEDPEPELPFNIRPYEVIVTVAFDNGCLVDPGIRAGIIDDVDTAVRRMYGKMWSTTVEESRWLFPGNQRRLESVSWDAVADRFPEQEYHKAFFVTIEPQGNGFNVACRECDTRVHEITPVYRETIISPSLLGSAVARLLRDSFRPCLMFQRSVEGEGGRVSMVLQTQAGEILPPDPTATQIVEGDVLRPFIRQMERRNPRALMKLRAITLTYLKALEIDREVSRGSVLAFYLTHLAVSPFGGKGRSQQHFAIRQRPTAGESRVRLVLQSRPDKPLISHRLALAYQLHYKDEEDGEQTRLVSDRNGEVTIRARDGHPTFWIRVYSGSSLLARVPYAPGLVPFDTIKLPDDSVRLGVEGEIQLLSDDLIDAIAVRGVLLARARKLAQSGDAEGVKEIFDRYDAVPSKDRFLERVSNIRVSALDKAAKRRVGTRRIKSQCDAIQGTVNNFFSDQKRAARLEEIEKIKQLAEQNAK